MRFTLGRKIRKKTNTSHYSSSRSHSYNKNNNQDSFVIKIRRFIDKTNEHVLLGINPGGVYQSIWCRDAAYILKDWFLSGNIDGTLKQICQIWSHQITSETPEKLVYGRGSPKINFTARLANLEMKRRFHGALPTTIYQTGFSEIYGINPDIDSTALMVSTTSWILARCIRSELNLQQKEKFGSSLFEYLLSQFVPAYSRSDNLIRWPLDYGHSLLLSRLGTGDQILRVCEFAIPSLLCAIDYLNSRDFDNDGLLEQDYNEDWMDTALRKGRIVYSQACWLLAVRDLFSLLTEINIYKEASKLKQLSHKIINAVDQKLWSDIGGCYIDLQETQGRVTNANRLLTQDVSLYLIAISQNTSNDELSIYRPQQQQQEDTQSLLSHCPQISKTLNNRAISTLDAIKKRTWKQKWPLVTEKQLQITGPWILKPYQYHNHTFWPWTTGIEMLARSRFNRIKECEMLLSKLAFEDHPHIHAFYEWVNPVTDQGQGSYPFRTGISAIRLALADIFEKINK